MRLEFNAKQAIKYKRENTNFENGCFHISREKIIIYCKEIETTSIQLNVCTPPTKNTINC